MKAEKILFPVIFLLFFSSCGKRYTQNETILKAESVLFNYPDSAFKLLSSIKNPEKLSKADYAAWCLHFTHAQYKLYLDIKSDSLIKNAVNYYDNSNLESYNSTAYYLWGCISELNEQIKTAMYAYKKADDLISRELLLKSNQIRIKGLINYRISNLLLLDEYYSESETYINIAI